MDPGCKRGVWESVIISEEMRERGKEDSRGEGGGGKAGRKRRNLRGAYFYRAPYNRTSVLVVVGRWCCLLVGSFRSSLF